MPTRFYFPSTGTADSSPTVSTGWARNSSNFIRKPTSTTKANSAVSWVAATPGVTTSDNTCHAQFVSAPLDVDQTVAGTFSMVVGTVEGPTIAADQYMCVGLRVMVGDTDTVRGVLRAPLFNDNEMTLSQLTRIVSAVAFTSVNALAGDRIVIEIGSRSVSPPTTATANIQFGDTTDGDYPLTSGYIPNTVEAPWLEFSQTLTFATPPEGTVAFTTDDAIVASAAEISNAATVAFTTDDAVVDAAGNTPNVADVDFTTDDAVVAAAGVVEVAGEVAFTTDDAVVAATGDSGLPTGAVEFTTDDAVVAAAAEISNAATVAFTTDDAVVAATGSTVAAPPTELFSVTVENAETGALLTGLTNVLISVQRDEDGFRFDFTDNQFRALTAAAPGVPKLAMDEFNVTNAPAVSDGYYTKALQVLTWSGDITITIEYNDGTRINRWVASSVEYMAGVRIKTGSRAATADVPSAAANAAAIDAAIMSDGLTYAQAKIVNNAILHGKVTGAGTTTESFWSVNQASVLVERARITVDASGNRTAVEFIDVDP